MEVIKSQEREAIENQKRLAEMPGVKKSSGARYPHHWFTHLFVWWIAAIAAVACASTVVGILFMYIVFYAVRDGLYALIESKHS